MAATTVTPDLLASPALALLLDLQQMGCQVELTPEMIVVTPASKLTAAQQTAVHTYAPDLALLVRCCDDGVRVRQQAMRRQLDASQAGMLPALLFHADLPYVMGHCFSCGDTLPTLRYGRCWRCALAWRLAAGVPIAADLADALDGARQL